MGLFEKKGFTLVEIMIVVAIIGLLAAIAIPNFIKAREATQKNTCLNNLRQIDAAKQQWALEYNKTGAAVATSIEIASYIRGGFPSCPEQGDYDIGNVNTSASCSVHSSY